MYKSALLGFNLYMISSNSMEPTLREHDIILADTWIYKKNAPQIDDIVLFHLPENDQINYIKRVVGLPNEQLMVGNKIVKPIMKKNNFDSRVREVSINTDQYFLAGDNLEQSLDSRHFGSINEDNIYAKAVYIIYSQNPDSILKTL